MKIRVMATVEVTVPVDTLHRNAEDLGWMKAVENSVYRKHSLIYRHPDDERPMLIIPTTEDIGDYASVVERLVDDFALAAGKSPGEIWKAISATEPRLA